MTIEDAPAPARFFFMRNGEQHGPMTLDELQRAAIKPKTPVWQPGMVDWVPAREVETLASLWAQPVERAKAPPPSPVSTDQFLFFDPSRPRVLGLIVLWGTVFSPLLYLFSSCTGLATMTTPASPGDYVINVTSLVMIPLGLATTAGIFVGCMLLRSRQRFGIWITAASLGLETLGGLLFGVTAFVLALVAGFEPYPDAVPQEATQSLLDVIAFVLPLGGWLFEWFGLGWLVFNWRRLRGESGG